MTRFPYSGFGKHQLRLGVFLFLAFVSTAPLSQIVFAQTAKTSSVSHESALPSWNDTAPRKALIDFVRKTTGDKNSSDYIAPEDRVAVFDNDGTLWTEQPLYFQMLFALERVKALAPSHPEWKTEEPFASILKGDIRPALADERSLMKVVTATQTNLDAAEFRKLGADWVFEAKHPKLQRPFASCIYQPMLEALNYLRAHGYKTYIVTGGDTEFVRAFSEKAYGVPPEQVIGSRVKLSYKVVDGKPVVVRDPEFSFNDDGPGKPAGIVDHIGRRPVIAFGNSDGDYEMLEYTTRGARQPALGFFVHHTDSEREYAYDRASSIGKLNRGLNDAASQGWIIIDMKNDWKTIYPPLK